MHRAAKATMRGFCRTDGHRPMQHHAKSTPEFLEACRRFASALRAKHRAANALWSSRAAADALRVVRETKLTAHRRPDSLFSPRPNRQLIHSTGCKNAIIFWTTPFNAPSSAPRPKPNSPNGCRRTRCAIPSPRTFSKRATTFAPCKICSATKMCAPRKSICTP